MHETIYQAIYRPELGGLCRDVPRVLRTGRRHRKAHRRADARRPGVNLGNLLRGEGEIEGACAAYQHAIDSGGPDIAPLATVNLGTVLHEQVDVAGAMGAYRHAIDSRHPGQAPSQQSSSGVC